MSNPIASVAPAQAVAQAPVAQPKAPASKPQPTPADTVKISHAAQTVLQESQETRAQTVKEAASGDNQARQVLAKDAAAVISKR